MKIQKASILSFWTIICMIVVCISGCKEDLPEIPEISLQLNLQKNTAFQQEINISQVIDYQLASFPVNIRQDLYFKLNTAIDSISLDAYKAINQYVQIIIDQTVAYKGALTQYQLDTAIPDTINLSNDRIKMYQMRLLNMPYTTVMNKTGKVLQSNINEVTKAAGGGSFTNGNQTAFSLGVTFPEFKLKKGDKWTIEIQQKDSLSNIEGLLFYTLQEWTDTTAIIAMDGEYISKIMSQQSLDRLKVTQSGTFIIYRKTGWVKSGKINQNSLMSTTDNKGDNISIKSKITLNTKEL